MNTKPSRSFNVVRLEGRRTNEQSSLTEKKVRGLTDSHRQMQLNREVGPEACADRPHVRTSSTKRTYPRREVLEHHYPVLEVHCGQIWCMDPLSITFALVSDAGGVGPTAERRDDTLDGMLTSPCTVKVSPHRVAKCRAEAEGVEHPGRRGRLLNVRRWTWAGFK